MGKQFAFALFAFAVVAFVLMVFFAVTAFVAAVVMVAVATLAALFVLVMIAAAMRVLAVLNVFGTALRRVLVVCVGGIFSPVFIVKFFRHKVGLSSKILKFKEIFVNIFNFPNILPKAALLQACKFATKAIFA